MRELMLDIYNFSERKKCGKSVAGWKAKERKMAIRIIQFFIKFFSFFLEFLLRVCSEIMAELFPLKLFLYFANIRQKEVSINFPTKSMDTPASQSTINE